jgi:hypothetical protein
MFFGNIDVHLQDLHGVNLEEQNLNNHSLANLKIDKGRAEYEQSQPCKPQN